MTGSLVSIVIARSEATKQSRLRFRTGLLRCARNDASGVQAEILRRIIERNVRPQRLRELYVIQKFAGLLRRLERIIGGEHHAIGPSAASVQLSGSAEHMPDVVTTMFFLM